MPSTSRVAQTASSRRASVLFAAVMAGFTVGMAALIVARVTTWWIWYIYLLVWTLVELRVARDMNLRAWHWILILLGICALDWGVIALFGE